MDLLKKGLGKIGFGDLASDWFESSKPIKKKKVVSQRKGKVRVCFWAKKRK